MATLKMGYVGCGFMAQKVHIPNLMGIPGCELVALAEVREELGRKVQARYRIPRLYRHHSELADDPEIQAVAVSAAFYVQGMIARDLLLAGKHVFMEKPMAIHTAQAQGIVNASRQTGAKLMVGYMKRYDAGNELFKEALDGFRASGELGEITLVRNHGFCGDWTAGLDTPMEQTDEPKPVADAPGPEWLPPHHLSGYLGYLQQYTHNINLMRWFLGAGDRVRVRRVDLDDDGYTGIVILDMDGQRAVLESGRLSHYRWDEHTQVYLQHGWLKTWAPPLLLRNAPAEVEIYRGGKAQTFSRPIPAARWSWSYKRELEHFVEQVLSGGDFRSSGEDTLTDVRLFEDIYKAYLTERGELR